jgi:beta-lactam-binding protein with PASTA domain/tRNA A-37 threonylcarbamoyl transferase component Bud32
MTAQQRVVGGRYEIHEAIGYGGMAEVHRGRDVRLGRDVAVKVLRSDLARDPSFQNRFRREAQAAAGLNHPSIVAVYDTGEDPGLSDGDAPAPYIVMEFVEGRTLREVLKSEGQLPARRAMEVTAEVCSALDFSHRSGIVHRDIKPANVMITNNGAVKVMDFGIARALADDAATMTSTSAVIGTAQYLSPEQARGESVDARSDVYSTGCLLYELITGHPPFTGDSPVAVAYQHVRETALVPSSANPNIPRALDSIVMKALAKNALNRYQTAGEMRSDLLRAIAGQPVEAESVMTDEERTQLIARPSSPTEVRAGVLTPVYDDEDDTRSHRGAVIWTAVVLALLIVIGVAAWAVLRNDKPPPVAMKTVDSIVGITPNVADARIRAAGFVIDPTHEHTNGPCQSATVAVGNVCTQSPAANASVAAGSTITYTIYDGPSKVTVTDLRGQLVADARKVLEKEGLVADVTAANSLEPAGTILDQKPAPQTQVLPGSHVALTVSNGQQKIPDVRGNKYDDARAKLNHLGFFNLKRIPIPIQTGYELGQVMTIDPAQLSSVDPKTEIRLYVAAPKPLPACSTPNPSTSGSSSGTTPSPGGSAGTSGSPTGSPSVTPSVTPSGNASPTCTP